MQHVDAPPEVPGRKTVVVVEDDREIRELEVFLLTAEGYRVVGAANGNEGLDAIRRGADAVVLDLMLPGLSGNEVLEQLGRDPSTAETSVIVVSAFARTMRGTPQVTQVINKPFDITDLLDAVARALDHGHATRS